MGGPEFDGALQVTERLVVVKEATFGGEGRPGAGWSSRLMVTAMLSVPPLPSLTVTVTE